MGKERSKGASNPIEGRMTLLICRRPKGHCTRHHLASHCSRRNEEQTRVSRTLSSESVMLHAVGKLGTRRAGLFSGGFDGEKIQTRGISWVGFS